MHLLRRSLLSLAAAGLLTVVTTSPAFAADDAAPARSTYTKERADCDGGRTAEDRATCLKEAGAAMGERKRNRLDNKGSVRQNAVDRCNVLAGKDKIDCLARIEGSTTPGQKTTTSGSIAGGGVLRETTTTTIGPAVIVPVTPGASAPG